MRPRSAGFVEARGPCSIVALAHGAGRVWLGVHKAYARGLLFAHSGKAAGKTCDAPPLAASRVAAERPLHIASVSSPKSPSDPR